jgi:hypothetical protein
MPERTTVLVRLVCRNAPATASESAAPLRLGVQQGAAVIDDAPADAPETIFTIPLEVRRDLESGQPRFGGPFAHGAPAARFVYLSWGVRNGATWQIVRRAKIHLSRLTWPAIERAVEQGQPIEAIVDLIDARGRPVSGSVKDAQIEWRV